MDTKHIRVCGQGVGREGVMGETERLDRIGAEVMGFIENIYGYCELFENDSHPGSAFMRVLYSLDDWHPSTDLAQAIMVVEKLCNDKAYTYEIYSPDVVIDLCDYTCVIIDGDDESYKARADTLPLAIMRAVEAV